jgi:predicted aminopeptidase
LLIASLLTLPLLAGCTSLRYYTQAAHGQAALIVQRRPITSVLHDPSTDSTLARRLHSARLARRFASQQLGLPDNKSYTGYVELHRPYVVWNVFAAPRFSVDAVPHCFPIAGCVAYRGWFREVDAQADAKRLAASGNDVWVGGVPAYSTLGWFADPILSSMLSWDDDELDGTIFHELAHQLIYVKGDTSFNESFATFVQEQGLREWRASRDLPVNDGNKQAMDEGFTHLVLELRERLKAVYESGLDGAEMAADKRREIADFRLRYENWRDREWCGDRRYDAWVAQPINNARLLPFGLYNQWVPAFAVIFNQAGRNWPTFYKAVRRLAKLPATWRHHELERDLSDERNARRGCRG